MKTRRIMVLAALAVVFFVCGVQTTKSADGEKAHDASDAKKVIKETLASKKLPKEIVVGNGEAYYGKVRMFAVGNQNTFTFWVYGSNPPPDYTAYTFSMSDPSGATMRKAVMYAIEKGVTVGVFADDMGRPTWIVVYP